MLEGLMDLENYFCKIFFIIIILNSYFTNYSLGFEREL